MKALLQYIKLNKWYLLALVLSTLVLHLFSKRIFQSDNLQLAVQKIERNLSKSDIEIKQQVEQGYFDKFSGDSLSQAELDQAAAEPYSFFIYKNDSLKFWSNYHVYYGLKDSLLGREVVPLVVDNNYFVAVSYALKSGSEQAFNNFTLVALLPIKANFFRNNSFQQSKFSADHNIPIEWTLSKDISAAPNDNIRFREQVVFRLKKEFSLVNYQNNELVKVVLNILLLFFTFYFFHRAALFCIGQKNSSANVYTTLVLVVILFRLFRYWVLDPVSELNNNYLFSPASFATDYFQRSLGDLLINVLTVYWLVRFYFQKVKVNYSHFKHFNLKFIFAFLVLLVVFTAQLYFFNVARSLVVNSSFTFDLNDSYNFNLYTLLSFVILGLITSVVFDSTLMLNNLLSVFYYNNYLNRMIAVVCSVFVILFSSSFAGLNIDGPDIVFLGFVGLLFILFNIRAINKNVGVFSFKIFVWLIFVVLFLSFHILYFSYAKEQESRKEYAASLLSNKDIQLEHLLGIHLKRFAGDSVLAGFFKQEKLNDEAAKDYVQANLYDEYFKNYELKIYSFNDQFQTLSEKEDFSREQLDKFFYLGEKYGSNNNISYQDSLGMYVCRFENQFLPDSLYRVYFLLNKKENKTLAPNKAHPTQTYHYAIYQNGKITRQTIPENVPYALTQAYPLGYTYEGHFNNTLIYKKNHKKIAVVINNFFTFKRWFQIFLFLFSFNVIIYGSFGFFKELWAMWQQRKLDFKFYRSMSFSNRFLLMCYIIILATFIISYFSISYTNTVNNTREIESDNLETSALLAKAIQTELVQKMPDTAKALTGKKNTNLVLNRIQAEYELPFNLYDSRGNAIYKSYLMPLYFSSVYDKINPVLYFSARLMNTNIKRLKENLLGKDFYSNYTQIRDAGGKTLYILHTPFINSIDKIKNDNVKVISSLFNSFALIFFLATILIYFATRYFNASIKEIVNTIKKTSLLSNNQKLNWPYDDEIGLLVKEYNVMIEKLEQSAGQLAINERDSAWREMAKQVAHEIKNPLTPMKLSLQHLQMAVEQDRPNIKEMANNVAKNLINQIDNLSTIATNFSQFARLPETKFEVLNINEIIDEVVGLLNNEEQQSIILYGTKQTVLLNADKGQLIRLFNNILSNALQSIPYERQKLVRVNREVLHENYRITISDNGVGISDEQRHKIFTPYFTTKSSGTGLGLAMCKEIVARHNGNIWFSSRPDEGTKFYIDLPIFKVINNTDDGL